MKFKYFAVLSIVLLFAPFSMAQDITINYLSPRSEFSPGIISLIDKLKTDLLSVDSKISTIEVKAIPGETSPELVRTSRSWFGFGNTINLSFFQNAKNLNRTPNEFSYDLELKILLNRSVVTRSQLAQLIERKFSVEVDPHGGASYTTFEWDHLATIYEYLMYFKALTYKGTPLLNVSSLKQIKRTRRDTIFDYKHVTGGRYLGASALIEIGRSQFTPEAFIHEFGHAVWYKLMGPNERQAYLAISWKDNEAINTEFISSYAATATNEDFPEHFSAFFTNPDRLKVVSKAKFDFIKFLLGNISVEYKSFGQLAMTLNNGIYYEKVPKITAFSQKLILQSQTGSPQYAFELTIPAHGDEHNYINNIGFMLPYIDKSRGAIYKYELMSPRSNIVYLPDYRTKASRWIGKEDYANGRTSWLSWKEPKLQAGLDLTPLFMIKGTYRLEALILSDRFGNQVQYPKALLKGFLLNGSSGDTLDASAFGFGQLAEPKFVDNPEDLYAVPPKVLRSTDIYVTRLTPPNRFQLDIPIEVSVDDVNVIYLETAETCDQENKHSLGLKRVHSASGRTLFEVVLPVQAECQKQLAKGISIDYKEAKGEFQLIHTTYDISIETVDDRAVVLEMPPLEESINNGFFRDLEDPVIDFGKMEFHLEPDKNSKDPCYCMLSPVVLVPVRAKDLERTNGGDFSVYIHGPTGRVLSLGSSSESTRKITSRYRSPIDGEEYAVVEIRGKSLPLMSGKYSVHRMSWQRKNTNEIRNIRLSQMTLVKEIEIRGPTKGKSNQLKN